MKKFVIVDGNSLANRAFYAMPYLTNADKQPSGAVFGFANLIIKLICEEKPDFFAVAFDHARKTFRNEIFADYKGTRKQTPPDLISQFPVIKSMLEIMGVKVFEFAGIEADDIIGTLARSSQNQNILVSGDRDLLQLVSSNTQVWLTKKGVTDVEIFDEKALLEKFGLEPSGIVELKSLMGDTSDNIPGVKGVGEKTALSLLQKYKTLENVYANIDEVNGKLKEKLIAEKDNAFMSKKLATIKTDCNIDFDIEKCKISFPFSKEVRNFFQEWNFRSLTKRNDIFSEDFSPEIIAEKIVLENNEIFAKFIAEKSDIFCYDLSEMEFAFKPQETYFIKKEIDFFSPCLETDEVIKNLKDIFEDKEILKITASSKNDIQKLAKFGIKLNNYFDIEIARYVLNAGMGKQEKLAVCDYFSLQKELCEQMDKQGVREIYEKIEMPLVDVLVSMENEGFKVDTAVLEQLDQKFSKECEEKLEKIYEIAGEKINLNSPKQVAQLLFDKLGISTFNNKKRSTSAEVLEEVADQHEIVGLILEYRRLSKLVGTYINVYQKICQTTGPVIHTSFNQTLTATGRLSSSEPNLQNIPTRNEEGKTLRKMFISKFDDGRILSADYSQIELRLLASMAHEDGMIEAFNNGIDIHKKTASEIFGVPVDKVTHEQRAHAKAVNFGIIYGMSDYGLSMSIKSSVVKARGYIESYFERYPKIKDFMNKNVAFATENGFVRSHFGRIRNIPEIKSPNGNMRKFGERVAMNMPLQGTASDVIKLAMIAVFERLKKSGLKAKLILQIHDELIVDCPKDEVEVVEKLVRECMENVAKFDVPLTVSVGSGKNLYDCK